MIDCCAQQQIHRVWLASEYGNRVLHVMSCSAGQLAGRKGAIVANTNLVKIAVHNGLKNYMLAPLPRGKGARKRAELGLTVSLLQETPQCICFCTVMYSHGYSVLADTTGVEQSEALQCGASCCSYYGEHTGWLMLPDNKAKGCIDKMVEGREYPTERANSMEPFKERTGLIQFALSKLLSLWFVSCSPNNRISGSVLCASSIWASKSGEIVYSNASVW